MKLYDEGKIRAIGISNFYVDRMVEFCEFNDVPMVNQMERHPLNQNTELQEWEAKYNVVPDAMGAAAARMLVNTDPHNGAATGAATPLVASTRRCSMQVSTIPA